MPLTHNEIGRLAGMANQLRPDWPVNSLTTFIGKHRHRTYRDVAVALAWVCADADTQTPARLNEDGPWWKAVTAGDGSIRRGAHTMRCPEHSQPEPCKTCRDEAIPPPPYVIAAKDDAVAKGQAARPHAPRVPLRPAAAKKETR